MSGIQSEIENLTAEQEFLKKMQLGMMENLSILLENQKTKVDNQDLVIQNQSLIIKNQEVIVSNQMNIIDNQKKIASNQIMLSVILKTQERILQLVEKLSGNQITAAETTDVINQWYQESKAQYIKNEMKITEESGYRNQE